MSERVRVNIEHTHALAQTHCSVILSPLCCVFFCKVCFHLLESSRCCRRVSVGCVRTRSVRMICIAHSRHGRGGQHKSDSQTVNKDSWSPPASSHAGRSACLIRDERNVGHTNSWTSQSAEHRIPVGGAFTRWSRKVGGA